MLSAEATKRGMGSALLRKPPKLARLVAGIAEGIDIPLTVKIRTGTSYSTINAEEVSILPCAPSPFETGKWTCHELSRMSKLQSQRLKQRFPGPSADGDSAF